MWRLAALLGALALHGCASVNSEARTLTCLGYCILRLAKIDAVEVVVPAGVIVPKESNRESEDETQQSTQGPSAQEPAETQSP